MEKSNDKFKYFALGAFIYIILKIFKEHCNSCWFYPVPAEVRTKTRCCKRDRIGIHFRPFETYKEEEEYNVGDLLKIPKQGETGKFILAIVENDWDIKEVCLDCAFHQNHYEHRDCCVVNNCVGYFRCKNQGDVYYKPLAEVIDI